MSEEKVEGKVEEPTIEVVEEPEVEEVLDDSPPPAKKSLSPEEEKAASGGWVPKEDWVAAGNDEAEWRTAREFNDRGEFISSIKTLRKQVGQYETALKAYAKHHEKVYDSAYKAAVEELKAHKKLAIREGDHELAAEIDDEIAERAQQYQQEKIELRRSATAPTPQAEMPEVAEWGQRNKWYKENEEMRDAANGFMIAYVQKARQRGETPTRLDVLEHAEKRVKKLFKTETAPRREAPNVNVRSGATTRGTSKTQLTLTPEEKQVMKALVDSGEMTKEQYLKDIATIRGVK